MAEGDLEKNAEFTQIFKKHEGEEDPLIVAQRFLNIFRQLHIFTAAKRKEFDELLLKQPVSVRGMFANLPGGSVLQEYVNDLEQKAGMAKSSPVITEAGNFEINEEISKAKILATALAEAQAQAHAAAPAGGAAVNTAEINRITEQLSRELSMLKQEIEENKRHASIDLKNLDENVINDIKKAIVKEIGTGAPVAAPAAGGEIKLTADASLKKDIMDIVSQVMTANKEMQHQNNLELAKIIAESQEKLARSIEQKDGGKAAGEIAEALAKVMEANAENAKKNNIELARLISASAANVQAGEKGEAAAAANLPLMEDVISGIVEKQSSLFRDIYERQSDKLGNVLATVLKENNQNSMNMVMETLKSFQKEYQRILEIQTELQKSLAEKSRNTPGFYAPYSVPISQVNIQKETSAPNNEVIKDFALTPFAADVDTPFNHTPAEEEKNILTPQAKEAPESKPVLSEEKIQAENTLLHENVSDSENLNLLDEISTEADSLLNLDEKPKKKKKKKKKKNKNQEAAAENAVQSEMPAAGFNDEDLPGPTAYTAEQNQSTEVLPEEEALPLIPDENIDVDMPFRDETTEGFLSSPPEKTENPENIEEGKIGSPWLSPIEETTSDDNDDGQQWEYVTEDEAAAEGDDGQQWEYVTEDEAAAEGDDGQQWEYVTEDEAAAEGDDGQQWEYVTEDEAAAEGDDGQQWEYVTEDEAAAEGDDGQQWEYVTEDEAAAEGDDGQQWEYVTEDEAAAEGDDGQQWEWEYVTEDETAGDMSAVSEENATTENVESSPETESSADKLPNMDFYPDQTAAGNPISSSIEVPLISSEEATPVPTMPTDVFNPLYGDEIKLNVPEEGTKEIPLAGLKLSGIIDSKDSGDDPYLKPQS